MNEHEAYHSENDHTYRTGSTNPPKSHRGLLTFLLILVILLATISTLLSMMNIRLFRLLEQENEEDLHFAQENGVAPASQELSEGLCIPELGLTGQEVTDIYGSYHHLPQGFYITQVVPGGIAEKGGLLPGDIVTAVNGEAVITQADFQEKTREGSIALTVFRENSTQTITLDAG